MYRQIDVDSILKNIDTIETDAKTIYLNSYEPTMSEINNVYKDIINFIKEKNRIVYGGYAQNSLIRVKNKDDVFYRDSDVADIEFYTPDPVGDLIDICDMLYKKQYKYVEGKEGVHNETYKVFVNFINYCDISYVPPEIYRSLPTIKVDGMQMVHPHFMLIDAYRVYCDPMTSYFRLKKTFTRFTTLMKYYPLNENAVYNKIEYDKPNNDVMHFIRKSIIHNSKLVVVGHYAFNQLMKQAKMPDNYLIDIQFYQLISIDYTKDVETITRKLKSMFPKIVYKSYYPFSQFLDKSMEWYIGDTLVLRVYGTNDRCIVYRYSEKKKTYFGTFQLLFLYNLIQYIMGIIRKNKFNETVYLTMLTRMLKARDKYLEDNKLTVLDKSVFQEFTLKCIGEPKDILRASLLERTLKRQNKQKSSFIYTATGKPGNKPKFSFPNTSGNRK